MLFVYRGNEKGEQMELMATIRVNKTKDYTVMSNTHFKEKEMSLKAKGLLSLMLSLPDEWNYSINGLVTLSKDGKDSVMGALNELEQFGYLIRTRVKDDNGRWAGYDYDIYEMPNTEKPDAVEPYAEKPNTENQAQLSTKELTTKKSNTKKSSTKGDIYIRTTEGDLLGSYKNIKLKETELAKLNEEYGTEDTQAAIEYLSEYIELKAYKAKSHYLAMKKWVFTAVKEERLKKVELEQREKRAQEIHKKQALNELKGFYSESSFDAEEFFEAAVKRTYGE